MHPRTYVRGVLWYGVNRVLELAEVKKGGVVYDLGSGDGRIVITAAKKYGARAVGF
jgi:cyclopropane fatty-acyl-phospholipid synthase-like methyltransferase